MHPSAPPSLPLPRAQALPAARELLRRLLRIRLFEERCLEEFSRGTLTGTTHTCIGQEANPVGVLACLGPEDIVVSNHRGHGHYLAHGGDMRALAAEMMGRRSGACKGVGGSQHLHAPNFYSNGVLGSTAPCAAGMALAEKAGQSGAIVVVFLGDGALGEGAVYETINMASLWSLPLLFVVENNGYAQTTPIALNTAGALGDRFRACGVETVEVATTDVERVFAAAAPLVLRVGEGRGPAALVIETYRFSAHSKGDDTRDPAEIERRRAHDPITVMRARVDVADAEAARVEAADEVERAFVDAAADPEPRQEDARALWWEAGA